MQAYGDHIEIEGGTLIPAPGKYHPALKPYVRMVREIGDRSPTIRIPILDSTSYAHHPSQYVETRELVLNAYRIHAVDEDGTLWTWTVWLDKFNRGIATRAKVVYDH